MPSQISQRTRLLLLVGITLLALGLRLYHLDEQSIWNDEGTSIALAARDLPTITANAASDIHPPLYYYLLHFWMSLVGSSMLAVRSLSVLFGVGVVLASYWLAKPLIGENGALLGASMVALSPFQIYYSQETRMYAMATLCGVLATIAFQHLLLLESAQKSAKRNIVAIVYALLCILAIYSHYLAAVFLVAHNLVFMLSLVANRTPQAVWSRRLGCWAVLQLLIVASYVPWLLLSWHSLRNWPAVSQPLQLRTWIPEVLRIVALGITVQARKRNLILALAGWAPALVGLWPGRRHEPNGPAKTLRHWLLPLCLLTPILVIMVLSLQRPMYKPKFLLLATPGFLLLQAYGILRIGRWLGTMCKRGWVAHISTVVLALLAVMGPIYSLSNLYWDTNYYRDDYRGIIEYISAAAGEKDAILINAPAQIETVDYYYHGPWPEYPLPLQRPIDKIATEKILSEITAKHERLYCIFWATDESDPEGFIEGWLSSHCYKTIDSWYGNISLVVYAVPDQVPTSPSILSDYVWSEQIRLNGVALLPSEPTSGDILQVTLFWQRLRPIEQRYKVFIHIVDQHGNIVGQRDNEPVGGTRPTNGWGENEMIADHYGVLIQPGTAPGPVTLRVGLYAMADGQRLTVPDPAGTPQDAIDLLDLVLARASSPPPIASLDIKTRDSLTWPGIQLLGHSLYRLGQEHEDTPVLRPGDFAKLVCYWQREGEGSVIGSFIVALERRGRLAWEQPLEISEGAYAPSKWSSGEIMRDTQLLHLPAGLDAGEYRLTIRPVGAPANDSETLQTLRLTAP